MPNLEGGDEGGIGLRNEKNSLLLRKCVRELVAYMVADNAEKKKITDEEFFPDVV